MNLHRLALTLVLVPTSLGCAAAPQHTAATPARVEAAASAQLSLAPAPATPPRAEAAPSFAAPAEELWKSVENPSARYIAVLGHATAHDDSVREDHLQHARRLAAETLLSFRELELAPPHFDRAALLAESSRRKLPGVAFECGVVRHDVDARGTHFSVNVTVVDLRTEDIVATLAGSATAPGPTSPDNEQSALEGALEGAMRAVPRLLASLEPTLISER